MTFDQWWATLTDKEQKLLGQHNARFVWDAAATAEREAVLQTIEALYNTQDPNPMYQEGYNHALDNIEEFVRARNSND